MRIKTLLLILLLSASQAYSQYYTSGQEPSSLRWYKIDNPNFRLIYTQGNDSLASVFNDYINSSLKIVPLTLNHTPSKFPVVLHGNSILSNGFVSWAPKRMEVVSSHPFDASPTPWLEHLALHELRHIVQLHKMYGNKYRFGNIILGQQAIGLKLLFTPSWFLEGDAVYTETALSEWGRGQSAYFFRDYLAHVGTNNGSKYEYDKWLLGSFKHHIPNHYEFGYQMVGYVNHKYGSKVWSESLEGVSTKLFFMLPFYTRLKKQTGYTEKELFIQLLSYNDSIWESIKVSNEENNNISLLESSLENNYIEYKYPFVSANNTLIALKTSIDRTPALVEVDLESKVEKTLHRPGYITSRVSYSKSLILWSEYKSHARWENQNYSELWVYKTDKQKATRITTGTRYFNPIAYNDSTILTIENTASGRDVIVALSYQGKVQQKVNTTPGYELMEICKGPNSSFFARYTTAEGAMVLKYDALSAVPDTLLGPHFSDISNLAYGNGWLYFTRTDNYIEKIFAVNVNTNKLITVSSSSYGLGNLSYNNYLVASAFNAHGSTPVRVNSSATKDIDTFEKTKPYYPIDSASLNASNSKTIIVGRTDNTKTSRYSNFKNLFNFHSWAPIYFNPTDLLSQIIEIYPGATILSQNLTGTLVSSFGYSYNVTHGVHANIEWLKWYPKIMASVSYGNQFNTAVGNPNSLDIFSSTRKPLLNARLRVDIPYSISSGNILSKINLGAQLLYNNNWHWDHAKDGYQKWQTGVAPYLSFYALNRMATRDLRPRLGFQFYVSRLESVLEPKIFGPITQARSLVYLPGLGSNHSLLIGISAQYQKAAQYIRRFQYTTARGYEISPIKKHTLLSADYTFPIVYPDLAIGPVAYIKRLFGNVYSDNAWQSSYISSNQGIALQQKTLHSVGIEIAADINFLRSPYLFRVGYSGGYRLDSNNLLSSNNLFHRLILSLDINSITGYIPSAHAIYLNKGLR